jgi:LPS sulfotransferase NodH
MNWRERFVEYLGPGILGGITFGDWLGLLRDNGFRVHPAYAMRAAFISWSSPSNSLTRWVENWRYAAKIKATEIKPPVFVLGHWRSGTTLLHDLLALDERFAYPNLFQVTYPQTFLTTETMGSKVMRLMALKHRPQDKMRLDPAAAWEDEFAICSWGLRTPYLSWAFPQRAEHYDRFLTFRDATTPEIEEWRETFRAFLKKLTFKYGKPLVLKSPTHTCRIKLLLEMFPDAKFVHIHRNPYTVFQSFMHTYATVLPVCRLQRTDVLDWEERAVRQYREVYDAFFEERGLIPAGRFHEICFEDLEKDQVVQMRQVYEALNLPSFATVEAVLRRYVESISGYQKNVFKEIDGGLKERLRREWARCFEEWGYAT